MTKTLLRAVVLLTPLGLWGCSRGECYVGVRGTAASVTVKSAFPADTCKALIASPAKFVGDIAQDSANDMYAMSDRPTQPVICEHTIDGRSFIVRDEGMLKVVGNILCSGLAKRADR
ncbi:MAG: hypothetical protein ABI672_15115 [Vicinamibacteria bacterium]